MALQTPLHLQRRRLICNRHLIDAAVAGRTANAFFYVNAVIEICVVRQVVYANPFDRFSFTKTGAHWFEIRAFGPNLFVAVHARVRRRHARRGGGFDGIMTVTTINAVVTNVMLMTKLHWLLPLNPLPGVPR